MVIFRMLGTKTVLIVKNQVNLPAANAIFKDTGVQIKRNGGRHLGINIYILDQKTTETSP